MTDRLAWIGLGRQGEPMALRLVEAGHSLTVWDRDATRMGRLARAGARAADSVSNAAKGAAAIFLCLPDREAVHTVLFDVGGVMASAEPGTIVIDHSSIAPDATQSFAQKAGACPARATMLDAPVSGGGAAAAAGKMIVWAGGEERTFNRARPWIQAYASRVHHMGATGSGQIAKACHQIVACGSVVLWEEALRLASACGLDPAQVADAMDGAAADSLVRKTFAQGLAAGDFPVTSLANMTKDLCAVQHLAKEHGSATPLAQAALGQFRTRIADLARPAGRSSSYSRESGS